MYTYKVKEIVKILDGDTIDLVVDLGFNLSYKIRVRMHGYDAPETYRPKTEAEYIAGEDCTKYFTELIEKYKDSLMIETKKTPGIYGRYTGILYYIDSDGNKICINDLMVEFIKENNYYKSILREEK